MSLPRHGGASRTIYFFKPSFFCKAKARLGLLFSKYLMWAWRSATIASNPLLE